MMEFWLDARSRVFSMDRLEPNEAAKALGDGP